MIWRPAVRLDTGAGQYKLVVSMPDVQALVRGLREDAHRSLDLALNLTSVLAAISAFSNLHQRLIENHAGGLALSLLAAQLPQPASVLVSRLTLHGLLVHTHDEQITDFINSSTRGLLC